MDDSDQDFVDLCSKLLKRVRKKPAESRQTRKAGHQPCSQESDGDSESTCAGTQSGCTGAEEHVICGGTGSALGDAEPVMSSAAAGGQRAERGFTAKDKVLQRMQQFKRASPHRMVHRGKSQPTDHEKVGVQPPPQTQRQDTPESLSTGVHPEPQDSDEALALRLQQELDREAADAQMVDLEDRGLFFCQICHRDLSHMTPDGRTQHLNRCLDESEEHAPDHPPPPPPPPPPGVPDCPICGKRFKSQKSRSSHLKRCSLDMGVAPAVLLQALQRQTEETQNIPTASTLTQIGDAKRKGPSKPSLPARKKPRKKAAPLDEDTMVALALSSSLLEQEQRSERETDRRMTSVLKWRPDTGKGRGKRKKGAVPRPPPLLLVQDAEAALARLQERVSSLLLRHRAPSPPTPTRFPSTVAGWSGAAPLWQKSALLDRSSTGLSDFYTPELIEFITPWESTATDAATSSTVIKPRSSVQTVSEGTPVTGSRTSILPTSSQRTASTSGALLMDLMELAEDGVTLTQCGHTASGPDRDKSAGQITGLRLSGFIPNESDEQPDLGVSGFLPGPTHTHSEEARCSVRKKIDQPGQDEERGSHQSVALSRLASDLSSMVNNPQLSDLQLQVDSGEVYFAHSFMVYARCPLLAEMVHESGFGVQEVGVPAAQRVLMNDVPGQAVFVLLQYLYTANVSIPASLQPHVAELASRFDLQELLQLSKLHPKEAVTQGDEDYMNQEENINNQTHQALTELLRSMWDEDDGEDEGSDTDGGREEGRELEEDHQADDLASGDHEISEEKVNEAELEEIYEFAATQRKREEEEEKDSMEEEEEKAEEEEEKADEEEEKADEEEEEKADEEEEKADEEEEKADEEEEGQLFTKLTDPKRVSMDISVKKLQPNSRLEAELSLDRSYSRLFSDSWGVYEEEVPSSLPSTSGPVKTNPPQSQHQSPHKPSSELSGRTLLQSSVSVVDDLSLSPPPSASNLPIPGQSPGQVEVWGGVGGDEGTDGLALKRESQGPRSICVPLSPNSPQKEPELIVLSDSSEEMEVVLSPCSPSPYSPYTIHKLQSYTHIKPQPVLKPNEPTLEKNQTSLEQSPGDPSSALQHPDCSPEVSWLIPSTPVQPGPSTATSSTQTKSSMRRKQLFPKGNASSSSSSVFSSPALPFNNRLQTSSSSTRVPAHVGPTEGGAPKLNLDETSSCDVTEERGGAALQSQRKLSNLTSCKQDPPLHIHSQPHSSTPLPTELHKAPAPLTTSPLHSDLDKRWTSGDRDRAPSESPEKTELGSFHLSPLSDPSDPPSSSSLRGHQSLQRCQRSVESSSHNSSGTELKRIRNEDTGDAGEQEEAVGSSFQHSFMAMDEPPIAFNDSWGFDAANLETNPGCFSLRLEDSGASSQRGERSPGKQHAVKSSSSSRRRPSPSSHSSHAVMIASSPPKAHSTPPSSRVHAPTGLSFTPSPPDPTTRTTPEFINSLLDSKIWDSWEEEDEEALPFSQRVNPSTRLKTPASSHNKRRRTLVPITPLPHYSDMDTPELKNKLNRFGVRPLPKRQMILKLKEIHQYTHQLVSSEEEEEAASAAQTKHPPSGSEAPGNKPVSCSQRVKFKEPRVPAAASSLRPNGEEEAELLSASQGSNTSSTAASEDSERSNPELCLSSDSDSDGGISASQTANRLQDRLRAVRSFILSDSGLYSQILQYQPLVLTQLQERLKAAGIRLGAAKLVDYLDSQCITFTTAKPGHPAPSRKRTGQRAKAASQRGVGRKRPVTALI